LPARRPKNCIQGFPFSSTSLTKEEEGGGEEKEGNENVAYFVVGRRNPNQGQFSSGMVYTTMKARPVRAIARRRFALYLFRLCLLFSKS
jgi:hypothetical protein